MERADQRTPATSFWTDQPDPSDRSKEKTYHSLDIIAVYALEHAEVRRQTDSVRARTASEEGSWDCFCCVSYRSLSCEVGDSPPEGFFHMAPILPTASHVQIELCAGWFIGANIDSGIGRVEASF